MPEIILEEKDFSSLADVHELLADELDFPDYYGQNLAALWDCLGDLDDPIRFIVSRADSIDERHDWFDRLVTVLQRANDQLDTVETIVR